MSFYDTVIFNATGHISKEISHDVRELWAVNEFGNDHYYNHWTNDADDVENYPHLAKYLEDNNVFDCLIHWWW